MDATETNGTGNGVVVEKNVNNRNVLVASKTAEENEVMASENDPLRNQKEERVEKKKRLSFSCGAITWLTCNIHFLPIFTALYILIVFFITYGIAVSYGHVEPDFPYISYTGIHPPERGWFSQLVNVGAVLMGINLYLRYLIIRYIVETNSQTEATRNIITQSKRVLILNKIFLTFGWISAIGLSMVANFQTVDMRVMHYIGASLAFGFGFLYCWTQSWVTWKLNKVDDCKHFHHVGRLQLLLSGFLTFFLISFIATKVVYKNGLKAELGTKWDTLRVPYLLSTITEWFSVLMGCAVFTLTYIPDFIKYQLTGPQVQLKTCDSAVESQTFTLTNLEHHVTMETENQDASSHDNVIMGPEIENETF